MRKLPQCVFVSVSCLLTHTVSYYHTENWLSTDSTLACSKRHICARSRFLWTTRQLCMWPESNCRNSSHATVAMKSWQPKDHKCSKGSMWKEAHDSSWSLNCEDLKKTQEPSKLPTNCKKHLLHQVRLKGLTTLRSKVTPKATFCRKLNTQSDVRGK